LWGFDIHLESMRGDQMVGVQHVPPKGEQEGDNEYPRLDLVIPPI
jgi:stage V sporulation protein R